MAAKDGRSWREVAETDEEIAARATVATAAMKSAIAALKDERVPRELAQHIVYLKDSPFSTRAQAHAAIGGFMMAVKVLAARLGVQVAVVAAARNEENPKELVTGVDSWAVDLFTLAILQNNAAAATLAAHRYELEEQIDRLAEACEEARANGSDFASAMFDRSCVRAT